MKKLTNGLGMALLAAMAVAMAAIETWWPKCAAAEYEELSGCPVSTECDPSVNTLGWKGTVEACASIQEAFAELKVAFRSEAPSFNTDLEASSLALNVHLTALNTREVRGGGSAGKEMAPNVAVADISGCA